MAIKDEGQNVFSLPFFHPLHNIIFFPPISFLPSLSFGCTVNYMFGLMEPSSGHI
jgi:hypothetical protein